MSQHMVIFQNPDGDPGYNQFESIEDAVGFVEKLRNEQGIDSIRIFELDEVKFDLKPVYKVELQALNPGSSSAPRPSPAQSAPQAAPAAPQGASAPAPPPSAPPASSEPPAPQGGAETPSGSPFAPPSEPTPPGSAPTPPADQPTEDGQPARRGLFGR